MAELGKRADARNAVVRPLQWWGLRRSRENVLLCGTQWCAAGCLHLQSIMGKLCWAQSADAESRLGTPPIPRDAPRGGVVVTTLILRFGYCGAQELQSESLQQAVSQNWDGHRAHVLMCYHGVHG